MGCISSRLATQIKPEARAHCGPFSCHGERQREMHIGNYKVLSSRAHAMVQAVIDAGRADHELDARRIIEAEAEAIGLTVTWDLDDFPLGWSA
jgi:hypothetical protein